MGNTEDKELTLGDLRFGQCFILASPTNKAFSGLLKYSYPNETSEVGRRALYRGVPLSNDLGMIQIYGTDQDNWYGMNYNTPVILIEDGASYYRKQLDFEALNKAKELCESKGYTVELSVWKQPDVRPEDGQHIAYRFEPFGTYHCGVYCSDEDSVIGRSGFTTWIPEVTQWYPIPSAFE